VAEALERLPELEQALRDGSVSWSVAHELTRIATEENERAWLDLARGRTVRQIEELVAGHKPGDRLEDAYDPAIERHVLRFDVAAETFATFGEAIAKLRRDAGSRLDDDAALLLLARHMLGGPTEQGRANYQIALTVCDACGRGWQHGRGELVEVESDVVEMASCDAQHLGRIDRGPASFGHSRSCEDAPTSDAHECQDSSTVAIDSTMVAIVDAGEQRTAAHVGAGEQRSAAHVGAWTRRARQDIPPAVRRLVMRRDGGRCVVPGCAQAVFVDTHHVVPRSEGGDHDPDTLVVLCCAHHRAIHRGQLTVEGRMSTGLIFRHADGTAYGQTVRPEVVAIHEEAFRALRALGFRETQARRALERVRESAHVGAASIQTILRQALALLVAS